MQNLNEIENLLRTYRKIGGNQIPVEVENYYTIWLKEKIGNLQVPELRQIILELPKIVKEFNYVCKFCGDLFIDLSDLCQHSKKEHRVRGNSEKICLKKYVDQELLKRYCGI